MICEVEFAKKLNKRKENYKDQTRSSNGAVLLRSSGCLQ